MTSCMLGILTGLYACTYNCLTVQACGSLCFWQHDADSVKNGLLHVWKCDTIHASLSCERLRVTWIESSCHSCLLTVFFWVPLCIDYHAFTLLVSLVEWCQNWLNMGKIKNKNPLPLVKLGIIYFNSFYF